MKVTDVCDVHGRFDFEAMPVEQYILERAATIADEPMDQFLAGLMEARRGAHRHCTDPDPCPNPDCKDGTVYDCGSTCWGVATCGHEKPCPSCGGSGTRPVVGDVIEFEGRRYVVNDVEPAGVEGFETRGLVLDPDDMVVAEEACTLVGSGPRPTVTDADLHELSDRIENLEQGIWKLHGLSNVREEPGGEHVNAIRYCGECKRRWPCPTVKLNTEAWQAAALARQENPDD